jgi:hypothetical protein
MPTSARFCLSDARPADVGIRAPFLNVPCAKATPAISRLSAWSARYSFACKAGPVCERSGAARVALSLDGTFLTAGYKALSLWFQSGYNISDTN